ncbi:MAG: hypothetical protein JJT75_04875 [Opitutales bacterium]|nr:hypothetical protein [Opitutales bacterium]MCH8539341.1 hypothetical protein [Opitutales bacterium]
MIDLLKKTLYAGIGATVTTKEQVQKVLHQMVEQGKLSKEEAEKMADEVVKEGKEEYEKSKSEMTKLFDEWVGKAGFVRKEEMAKLEARIATLEKEKKTATKKTAK